MNMEERPTGVYVPRFLCLLIKRDYVRGFGYQAAEPDSNVEVPEFTG